MLFKATDWEYIGEGGANVVFKYTGSDQELREKVLRVRKNGTSNTYPIITLTPLYYKFMCSLLGCPPSTGSIECFNVDASFLEALNERSNHSRPKHRILSGSISKECKRVLLLPNLISQSHAFSVEIKPKWSGNKYRRNLGSVFDGIGNCNCRYCLAQISKGRREFGSIHKHDYCPQALFSQNPLKVEKALCDLFMNPSNQLKVFRKSKALTADELKDVEDELVPNIADVIANDVIFKNLIGMQEQLLDSVDLEALLADDISFDVYMNDIERLCNTKEALNIKGIPSYLRLLMVMSIRDSSFIIRFNDDSFTDYQVNFIDLDIKSLDKLEYYLKDVKEHDF